MKPHPIPFKTGPGPRRAEAKTAPTPGRDDEQKATARRIAARIAVDVRALAALRVAMGGLLLLDLAYRSVHLRAFHSDAGVLPAAALKDLSAWYYHVSIHAWHGALWYEAALFLVAACAALMLILGWRTRIAAAVSFLLHLSLLARNPLVLHSGDALLLFLLLWGLFLPLGARWSVDALVGRSPARAQVAELATTALLVQVVLMYVVNAAHKAMGGAWWTGEAMQVVYATPRYTTFLGDLVAHVPAAVAFAGQAWLVLLACAPLLLVVTGRARLVLASAYLFAHLGMFLTIRVGLFPLISMVALIPFFPPRAWDVFESRLVAPVAQRLGALSGPRARSTPPSPRGPRRIRLDGARRVLVAVLLAGLVAWSGAGVAAVTAPTAGGTKTLLDRHANGWAMFADPSPYEVWFVAPARLADGSEVDALHGGPVVWDAPRHADHPFPDIRWRTFLGQLHRGGETDLVETLALHLCTRWDATHDIGMVALAVHRLEQPVGPRAAELAPRAALLGAYDCPQL